MRFGVPGDYLPIQYRQVPYRGTRFTITQMEALAAGNRGELSYPVRHAVEDAIRYVRPRDQLSQIAALYQWFIGRFHFYKDPKLAEQVKDPERLAEEIMKYGIAVGDCDCASTFLLAAPRTIGIRTKPVRVGFKRGKRGRKPGFSHVFVIAYDQKNRPIVIDPVAGKRTLSMLGKVTRRG